MQSEERQKRFEEHLSKVEFASLDELSELADASVSTVRRDLVIHYISDILAVSSQLAQKNVRWRPINIWNTQVGAGSKYRSITCICTRCIRRFWDGKF